MNERLRVALRELGFEPSSRGNGTPYAQPHPITIGRKRLIPPEERGEIEILKIPSFPMMGQTWALQVQIADDAKPWTVDPTVLVVPSPAYLFLRLHWTQGQADSYTVDLDLPAGGAVFPVLADSLRVCVVNTCPTPTPVGALPVTLLASIGYDGARVTGIPRRTVLATPKLIAGAAITFPIPRSATQVTLGSLAEVVQTPQAAGVQFFDFLGTQIGSAFLAPTAVNVPIDIPQAACVVTLTNTGALASQITAVFRIAL